MWNSEKKHDLKCKRRKLSEYDRRSFSGNKGERRKRGKTTVTKNHSKISRKSESFNPVKIEDQEEVLKPIQN